MDSAYRSQEGKDDVKVSIGVEAISQKSYGGGWNALKKDDLWGKLIGAKLVDKFE